MTVPLEIQDIPETERDQVIDLTARLLENAMIEFASEARPWHHRLLYGLTVAGVLRVLAKAVKQLRVYQQASATIDRPLRHSQNEPEVVAEVDFGD